MPRIVKTAEFDRWLNRLRDRKASAKITFRIDRLARLDHAGDVSPVGEGISEMRIHYGPGYRLYFRRRGEDIVVLLVGGDKGTQEKDIALAKELARRLESFEE